MRLSKITPKRNAIRILALPGYACSTQIWNAIRDSLDKRFSISWLDWPRERIVDYHSASDFADWVEPMVRSGSVEIVIGHSMGGLVALELAGRANSSIREIVLIETFLTSPAPFFQNLLMDSVPEKTSNPVLEMMKEEKPFYAPDLSQGLRQLDVSGLVMRLSARINVLYGDRGCGDPERVMRELNWSQELRDKVQVKVIENACHFPMIENPRLLVDVLVEICKGDDY